MKNLILPVLMLFTIFNQAQAAGVPSRVNIEVNAEISTGVRIFAEGKDVTNSSIPPITLKDKNGYMEGITPVLHFIGNASSVSISLQEPTGQNLISENNDEMRIKSSWVRADGGEVITAYPLRNQPVYPTLQDVPDQLKGVRIRFISAARSETYPLGLYSGTYVVTVTPSV
ncbi:hypothetical protein C7M52_03202 [Mixta theicola]|nr:hypothetical protein [Mixta theicola]QHM77206.1 hypothetical protein C7M52_03202 [Mixta theicola]